MEAEGSPSQKSEPKSTKDAAKPSSKRGLSETQLPDKNCGTAKKSRFFEYQGPIRRSRRLYEKSLPRKGVGFMDLPGELRNMIYDHYFRAHLTQSGPLLGHEENKNNDGNTTPPAHGVSLSDTIFLLSKTTRSEAITLACNQFAIGITALRFLEPFTKSLGVIGRRFLKTLHIPANKIKNDEDPYYPEDLVPHLQLIPNLQRVDFVLGKDDGSRWDRRQPKDAFVMQKLLLYLNQESDKGPGEVIGNSTMTGLDVNVVTMASYNDPVLYIV